MIKRILKFLGGGAWWQLLALVIVGFLFWYLFSITKPQPTKLSEQRRLNEKEFQLKIDSLNARFDFLTLKRVTDPRIYEYENPSFIVEIIQKAEEEILSPYYFETSEYGIHAKNNQISRLKKAEVCEVLRKLEEPSNKSQKIPQALKNVQTEVSFNLSKTLSFKVKNLHLLFWELLYASQSIPSLNIDSCKILLRGFADGSRYEWDKRLRQGRYKYDTVKYSPVHPTQQGKDYPSDYSIFSEYHIIDEGKYRNSDLPFLRSRYIRDEFLSQVTDDCNTNKPPELILIEGKEIPDLLDAADQRRVEIFIQAYF